MIRSRIYANPATRAIKANYRLVWSMFWGSVKAQSRVQ